MILVFAHQVSLVERRNKACRSLQKASVGHRNFVLEIAYEYCCVVLFSLVYYGKMRDNEKQEQAVM